MTIQDKIRGSLFGGAVGDALGYAIEFLDEKTIFSKYGENGIQEYNLDTFSQKAIISDDTQMTLFTASAILFREHRFRGRGIASVPRVYANMTYQDWLITQEMDYEEARSSVMLDYPDYPNGFISVIFRDVPELFNRRAPGLTCLSALEARRKQRKQNKQIESFIDDKVNNSKGCGGIMRVAPIGMACRYQSINTIDMEGAECAAITHSHSLGYMSAAVLAHIIHRIVFSENEIFLKEIVTEARETVTMLFKDDENISELIDIIDESIRLSENTDSDLNNIHHLGEGWVAEEALAIAIYCSLRYQSDFSGGVIAAVNHKGDSDSTGAITGNILGALNGFEAIEQKWKDNLELYDTILQVADMLYESCI